MSADIFDLEADPLQRDRFGRPLLIPAAGGDRTAFTRMSTLAGYVCDDFGLTTWTQRLLAIGYGQREDLTAMVAALPPLNDARCDKSTLTREQLAQDRETKAKLDEYNEQALEAAGRNYKANHGTAVHGFIQHGHAEDAPERMRPDVESCYDTFRRRGIEVICSEMFVANDRLRAAGSFDHLVRLPTFGIVIADVKTAGGRISGKGLQFGIQLSGYADGEVYDPTDDTRQPLESLTDGERINRNVGLVVHVPLGGARTELYLVDLNLGRRAASIACQVRDARQAASKFMTAYPEETR